MQAAQNILVIKHGAFGDIMQAEGALHDIDDNYPHAKIAVLTAPPYRRIMERCPWIDRVFIDPRASRWRLDRMFVLGKRLRTERFDMVFDLQNSPRTASYYRWFFKGTPWSGTVRGASHPHRAPKPKTIPSLQRLAGQLHDAGLTTHHTVQPDLSWMADDIAPLLREAGIVEPYIVLIPGSSARHPEKRWPYYAELAARLSAQGHRVVIAPGPDELELANKIPATVLRGPRGFLNWFELAGLFKQASFVIGNDTGPTHLAAHIGAQGLALFGPRTSPLRTGIERAHFSALEVVDLSVMPVARVIDELHLRARL